jgi:hypothetical protein
MSSTEPSPVESPARLAVPRSQLWEVIESARKFELAARGRLNIERFLLAQERLRTLLEVLPR